jgi:hypothetical protein
MSFQQDLENLINSHSLENYSDTPDFILAQFIVKCLEAWNDAVCTRDKWYDFQNMFNSDELANHNECNKKFDEAADEQLEE